MVSGSLLGGGVGVSFWWIVVRVDFLRVMVKSLLLVALLYG